MRWKIDGTYFENCNCDMVCPCSTSALTLPADKDRCNVAMAFHVRPGEINGDDVGGLNVFVVADTPAVMSEDVWNVGVLMNAAASPEAEAKLFSAFGMAWENAGRSTFSAPFAWPA